MAIYRRKTADEKAKALTMFHSQGLEAKVRINKMQVVDKKSLPNTPFFSDVLEAYGDPPEAGMFAYRYIMGCPEKEVNAYVKDILNQGRSAVVKPGKGPENRDVYMLVLQGYDAQSKSI